MALYDQVYVFIDGGLAAEETTVDTELVSDIQPAKTVAKGFAGVTPAPVSRTISVESLVPVTGFEYDFETAYLNSQEVEITLQLGGSGKKATSKGYFTRVSVSAGVGRQTTVSFDFEGTPEAFS